MKSTKAIGWLGVTVLALMLTLSLTLSLTAGLAAQGDNGSPMPGTVTNVQPLTILSSYVITNDRSTAGFDVSRYNSGDLFMTVDVGAASALTTVLQYSADGVNFANCYWSATKSDGTFTTNTCRTIQSADGTAYIRAPIAGTRARLNFDVTGTVTVTAATLVQRNN